MRILFALLMLCHFEDVTSQDISSKSWAHELSRSTVSFGIDTVVAFQSSTGEIVKKRLFNTIGTGVVFYTKYFKNNDTLIIPSIVTAKHVIFQPEEGYAPKQINIRFDKDESKGLDEYFGIPLMLYDNKGRQIWLEHPDPNVDLACIPIDLESTLYRDSTIKVLGYSSIKSLDESFDGQEIYVLGFPGIGGLNYATKPIMRRGIISWISPVEPNRIPFLIDCNIYPGNSGGPVFSNESGVAKMGGFQIGGGFMFLGIVSKMLNRINPIASESYKTLKDDKGKIIYSIEGFSLGVIEPSFRVRELLSEVEKQINRR